MSEIAKIELDGKVCSEKTCPPPPKKILCCDNPTGRVCATKCDGPSIPLDGAVCNDKTNCVSTPPPPPPPKQVYCCRAAGSTMNLCVQATTDIGCGDREQVLNQTFLTYDECEPICEKKINSSTSADR